MLFPPRFHHSAGFFLDHPNTKGENVHTDGMKTVLALSDFVGDDDCMKAYAGKDVWKCGFAQVRFGDGGGGGRRRQDLRIVQQMRLATPSFLR